jgi:transglutaminase-like putative cysteine protease
VLEADWVPEASVVIPAAIIGLLLSTLLAKRPLRGWFAWLLILIYGFLITTIQLAALWPPLRLLAGGWEVTSQYWRQNGALFMDRMAGWFEAAFSGGRSQETLPFAFGLGMVAWTLAAYVGWSTYRQRRPLLGLTAMGAALAFNGFYGEAKIWWAALFVGFTALLAAILHFTTLEQDWQASDIDFSDQIRFDLIFYAGAIAIGLLIVAFVLPAFPVSSLSRALLNNEAVVQAEDSLERVFAGVRQPRRGRPDVSVEGVGGSGMPRSYLLGDPPELYETVFMEATVGVETGAETELPEQRVGAVREPPLQRTHWRGPSYDEYTGRGWALSSERQELIAAGALIPLPSEENGQQAALPEPGYTIVSQSVTLLYGQPTVRYTLGLPLRFDQEVSVHWRGVADLSWVQGEGRRYQASSQVSNATAAELRQTSLADVPDLSLARYTELPATVPVRVHELAQEIAGDLLNPYDQARALEQFLRQYPYSLNVALPPAGVDPVDFFLFEQQEGYCDYYASAMTVMARSLGLPARIGVGFLPQAPDETGVQTIYQINGHSWPEIYFPGYGWIEFEPTAAFPSPHEEFAGFADRGRSEFDAEAGLGSLELPAIPDAAPQRPFPWRRVALIALAALALWLWQRQRSRRSGLLRSQDGVLWAYGRMGQQARKLGYAASSSQTPAEFSAGLIGRLDALAGRTQAATSTREYSYTARLAGEMSPHIERLTDLFVLRQYSRQKRVGATSAVDSWHHLRRAFWLLRLITKVKRRRSVKDTQSRTPS